MNFYNASPSGDSGPAPAPVCVPFHHPLGYFLGEQAFFRPSRTCARYFTQTRSRTAVPSTTSLSFSLAWQPRSTHPTSLPAIPTSSPSLSLAPLASGSEQMLHILPFLSPPSTAPKNRRHPPLLSGKHSSTPGCVHTPRLSLSKVKCFTAMLDSCPPHFLHPLSWAHLLASLSSPLHWIFHIPRNVVFLLRFPFNPTNFCAGIFSS